MIRKISWLIAAIAYLGPACWAYIELESIYGGSKDEGGYVCGLPVFAIICIACLSSAIFSFIGFLLNWFSFYKDAGRYTKLRILEMILMSVPFFIGGGYFLLLYFYY